MKKIPREHVDRFVAMMGGMPVTLLLRFPDGGVEELGGVVITTSSVKAAGNQFADAIEIIAKMMRKQADEYVEEKCPHHTDNPSAN